MNFLGFTVGRTKSINAAAVPALAGLSSVYSPLQSFFGMIRESFAGAWQKNVTVESNQNILAFSAVYACVSLISDDIAKLRPMLTQENDDGTWTEVKTSPFASVLKKPNNYQTRIQFLSQWITSKLLYGNTYVLKEREDVRGMVKGLHILDPRLVRVLVAEDGSVYYQIMRDLLAGIDDSITVAASEMIHDRMITLWHPLVGVTPIYACGSSSTQGIRIQANSAAFFENMSRPSGQLTAPGAISKETADRLKADFETNFSGSNIGRLLVTGDGLQYQGMSIPAQDAQLIEQLRWTVEDVARCFHVPIYKIVGTDNPKFTNIAALNQDYYSQTLQAQIEPIELLLSEGIELPANYCVELDLDGILRMDPLSRATQNETAIRAGYLTPNEARRGENLRPVDGGNTPYLQQQNFSLAALAKRDATANPFATATPAPLANPTVPTNPDGTTPPATDPAAPTETPQLLSIRDDKRLAKDFADALIARIQEVEYV